MSLNEFQATARVIMDEIDVLVRGLHPGLHRTARTAIVSQINRNLERLREASRKYIVSVNVVA